VKLLAGVLERPASVLDPPVRGLVVGRRDQLGRQHRQLVGPRVAVEGERFDRLFVSLERPDVGDAVGTRSVLERLVEMFERPPILPVSGRMGEVRDEQSGPRSLERGTPVE